MLLPWLRLLRIGTLFSPAADVVAGACLVGGPWSVELGRAVGASVLVYAAGMVLNDHADRREDAVQRPERPLPSGAIAPASAFAFGLALLAGGVALAPVPGWHGALAALVLAYDYLLKRSPVTGALTMGLLRGLNLLAGAVAVQGGVLPEQRHVVATALAYVVYIVAVTLLGVLEDAPQVTRRAVEGVQSAPPVAATLALFALPEPRPAAWLGLALALVFLRRTHRHRGAWDRTAIRRSMTWLLLGTMVFTSLTCLGCGRPVEALAIAAAILPARWISRRIALT
ncbi:MAG: UbiA family prenyltransferase [Planctomycetes bacterium]|nr:UbiA family prenyltransferase [Planctomycetota bacterium]